MDQKKLREALLPLQTSRTLILGVGNRLKGDDGIGPHLCDLIQEKVQATVIDTGTVPENYLGPITRLKPQAILLLDATDLGQAPGSVAVLGREALKSSAFSTHGPSVDLFLDAIGQAQTIHVAFLGIQPLSLRLGVSLSDPVAKTAPLVAEVLIDIFGHHPTIIRRST